MRAGGCARRNSYGATAFVVYCAIFFCAVFFCAIFFCAIFVFPVFLVGGAFTFVLPAAATTATAARSGREADAVRHQ